MKIGRVVASVVATRKDPSHEGRKILLVQPLDTDDSETGDPILALDSIDAGIGDRVLVVQEGWSAAAAVDRTGASIDAAVVGIIDEVRTA